MLPDAPIAIHESKSGFSPYWIDYCRKAGVPYKVVNCYNNDIINQLEDCIALLWHHSHSDPRDVVVAKQILYALEHTGFKVFPDFRLSWHFDDKVGQKYLFEALDIPTLPTYVFVELESALAWAANTVYPIVFKLRHGASSSGVRLVHTYSHARRLIRRAFGRGFPVYSPWENLKERRRRFGLNASNAINLFKGIGRIVKPPRFSNVLGPQKGYVLFQDFAPGNDSDVRVVVVGDKAFGTRRWVRPGDFRASGSQRYSYDPDLIDIDYVALAFELTEKLGGQCLAFDFVRKKDNSPAVTEISYGFGWKGSGLGFWDRSLQWHSEDFRPEDWMVDFILNNVRGLDGGRAEGRLITTQLPPGWRAGQNPQCR